MITFVTIAMLYGFILIFAQLYGWGMDAFSRLLTWAQKHIPLIVVVTLGCIASLLLLDS